MIATGLLELDSLMCGGLDDGELGIISSGAGVGKSHILINFGSSALRQNKKVWHVSFELAEHSVYRRYDACLDHKQEIHKYLRISEFPANDITFQTLLHEYDKLLVRFSPDILILDYPELIKSHASIYPKLRNFGIDQNLPIWGASQLNRVQMQNDTNTMALMIADIVLKLSRSNEMDVMKRAQLHVIKNRKGIDNITIPLRNVDLSKSYFEIDSYIFTQPNT